MLRPKMKKWKGELRRYIHVKFDGHYTELSNGRCMTRKPTDITAKVERYPWFQRSGRLPDGITLMGEIYAEGGDSSTVKTAINDGTAKFVVFAVHGLPVGLELESVESYVVSRGWKFANYREYAGESAEELMPLATREGFVLKDGNLLNWQKLKPVLTEDFIILGFKFGVREHLIGSIRAGMFIHGELVEVASISGFEESDKIWMTEHQKSLVGQVFEASYQGRGSQGGYRHPRFIRMRPDKPASQCQGANWPAGLPGAHTGSGG